MSGWAAFWIMLGIIISVREYSQAMITCCHIETDAWDKTDEDEDEDED